MTDKTINTLDTELVTVGANDLIGVWDVAAGQYKKAKRSNVVGATITGAGTIATGGFTLTVAQSGTAALKNVSQTFTDAQAIAPTSTSVNGLEVNMPTSTSGKALQIKYSGTERASLQVLGGNASSFILNPVDTGNSYGPYMAVLGNNNASTPSAGALILRDKGSTDYSIWPDDSGVLRIHTTLPTNALDTAGVVVGAQTSHVDYKLVLGAPIDDATALALVCAAAAQVARFVYRNGAFNGEEFSGVVLDGAKPHRYGMDADPEHPAGKSLNIVNAIGDLFLAVRGLAQRVEQLEAAQK
jgi:hypothetical protein